MTTKAIESATRPDVDIDALPYVDRELDDEKRIQKKETLDVLDTKRYELQGPKDENDLEGWKIAVNNTKSQLESQAGSMFNLELLQKYGANAWRVHNYQLEADLAAIKKRTEELRQKILEINRERKSEQTEAAASLSSLENKWSDLITQNLQVSIACSALENEVQELRRHKQSF
ncbi:Pre-mRNA-splicing factor SPF27 [Cokeromyces recurvatus]|uniref:Pre-mRNA-splicing factor SPF27 n=1 Tax=Cokeromyces recurvatus TaxID=90255 RepID=UPI00221FE070|nr:Pre-mRNA-splicing factor SPF27 [Cokeromyces recurvatus]KAI7901998.1 Pre-mRNA-splicing factor SPF27 [Cokeromyces recurvatus]